MNAETIKKLANEAYSYLLNECDIDNEQIQILASYILAIREKAESK